MSRLLSVLVAALAAATLGAAQLNSCETTCEPKLNAATKCVTISCACYAYDDPAYNDCLKSECGKGYASVREIYVLGCADLGVTLGPDPAIQDGASTQTTTGASNPQKTGTSGTTSGGASGGGSSSTGSGSSSGSGSGSSSSGSSGPDSGSSAQSTGKDRLSTAELIGIVIGSVSALATIVGVWVTIKKRKGRSGSNPAHPAVYQQLPPPAPTYPPVQNIHVAPVYQHGPPPGYQPPPAYHTVHVGWRK